MQTIVLILFLAISFASYATQYLGAPPLLKFLPEALTAPVLIYVLSAGIRRRFDLVSPKYWIAFGAMTLVILAGVASNSADSGPILMALRYYLRAMPLFFLPAVFDFKERDIRRQLGLLMLIGLVQLPLAGYQRWVLLSQFRFTGDDVRGTLLESGILSIYLICAALIPTAMYLRGYLSKLSFYALLAALLFPTMINETKVSFIYVPLGLLIVFMIGAESGRRIRVLGWAVSVMLAFGAIFVPVYDRMKVFDRDKESADIVGFFNNKKELSTYLSKNITGLGTKKDIRRGDAIRVPVEYLARDPIHLTLGLGLGSISPSNLGRAYEGRFRPLFEGFLTTSLTYFLVETGLLGTCIVLLLYWLNFTDAVAVARHDNSLVGAIALGWTGVVTLMAISIVYTTAHMFESLSYLYWYFSGLIAAARMRMEAEQQAVIARQPRTVGSLATAVRTPAARLALETTRS